MSAQTPRRLDGETPERLNGQTPGIVATEFLPGLVKAMVRNPDEAAVYWAVENGCVMVDVEVAPEDLGRLIGHKGVNAKAMRTLLDAVGIAIGKTIQLNISRDGKGAR